jgi:hypothetical protein
MKKRTNLSILWLFGALGLVPVAGGAYAVFDSWHEQQLKSN